MLNSSIVSSIQAPLGFSFNRFSGLSRSFKTRYNVDLSTVETPNVVTSNKAYIKAAADAVVTVTVGEISLDGGSTWVTSGVRGTFKYMLMRGESSTDYSTAVINSATIGGVEYNFVIWTKADTSFGPNWIDSESWDDNKIWTES